MSQHDTASPPRVKSNHSKAFLSHVPGDYAEPHLFVFSRMCPSKTNGSSSFGGAKSKNNTSSTTSANNGDNKGDASNIPEHPFVIVNTENKVIKTALPPDKHNLPQDKHSIEYEYDEVFDEEATQYDVYSRCYIYTTSSDFSLSLSLSLSLCLSVCLCMCLSLCPLPSLSHTHTHYIHTYRSLRPYVEHVTSGANVTFLTHGTTQSGKTHTLLGNNPNNPLINPPFLTNNPPRVDVLTALL